MTFFAGDEVSALVLDVGTSLVKAGYAGEDTPKCVFPSYVGVLHQKGEGEIGGGAMAIDEGEGSVMSLANETKIRYFCGINQLGRKDGMEMEPAMKHGLVHNWDILEKLWDHALCERLGMRPREHPVLLTESAFNTREIREKYTEIFFEKYDVPAFFVAKDPVCSCFANGRSTGLVLDVGAELTTVTPVHDGYALKKGITRSLLAGDRLSDEFLYQIANKGHTVLPRFSVKRKVLPGGKIEIQTLDFPLTTDSYRNFMIRRVINDLKESTGRVSEGPFDDQSMTNIPSVEYDLPNGVIEVGNERFSVPESLFRPEILKDQTNIPDEGALVGLHELAYQSAKKCDVDLQKELLNNIVVCGGGSLLTGFVDRFQREISTLSSLPKLRVIASGTTVERNFSVWLGGSILGSLGSFQQMWISKEEYGDFGKSLVERKCP